ncbi:transposase [Streptomyces uncialis]|uniref:IS110 family transposase n=1 Tax=Streptomyces uncialis TaxID=1048205 RepID=UPI00380742E4
MPPLVAGRPVTAHGWRARPAGREHWFPALVASGYQVYAINPRQVARFKERYASSGAKSDNGAAHALADLVRAPGVHRSVHTPDMLASMIGTRKARTDD